MTLQDLKRESGTVAVQKRIDDNLRRLAGLRKHLADLVRLHRPRKVVKLEITNLEREIKADQEFLGRG